MRLLLLNPNTTQTLTDRLATSARRVLPHQVELLPITAHEGFPYISSRAEVQIAGAAVLSMLADRVNSFDAAIIAAFGDPGLDAARELFDLPVVGMSEAAILTALALGRRFAFVTFSPWLAPWYEEQVTRTGVESRFAGTFTPNANFCSISDVAHDLRQPLTETCRRAATHADVVILTGAPIAGLARDIACEVPAVLLDPIQAAALHAFALHRLHPLGANAGSFSRPPAKESAGLPEPLSSWIAWKRSRA